MCEQLTSCGIKVTEPYGLAIHTINSHSRTWAALKLETSLRCDYREMEWVEGRNAPDIRWREDDSAETRKIVDFWLSEKFPSRIDLVNHCIRNAQTVYASGCGALTTLDAPNATYVDASGCAALQK